MRLIFTNTSGAGVQAALTGGEDLYLAEGVYFGSTTTFAITSAGSSHRIDIHGKIVSEQGVILGDDGSEDSGNRILIHKNGMIQTPDDGFAAGVDVKSFSSIVTNQGWIESHYGVVFGGLWTNSTSRLVNSGTIIGVDSTYGTIIRYEGAAETIIIDNTGTIRGETVYNSYLGSGVDIINNSGVMIGDIFFFDHDDTYNGKKGYVNGIVDGGDGADILNGGAKLDHFLGGAGADKLYGYLGKDKLGGGAGADTFIYKAVAESAGKTVDTILDFTKADTDLINIHAIDANSTKNGNQDFTFIGNVAFDGDKGDLRFFVSGGNTTFQADINGDRKADFTVKLTGEVSLAASDFLL